MSRGRPGFDSPSGSHKSKNLFSFQWWGVPPVQLQAEDFREQMQNAPPEWSGQTDFGPQLKFLNKQLFTLVAWDPRGYGKSIPPARDYPLDFFERDAKDAVDLMQDSCRPIIATYPSLPALDIVHPDLTESRKAKSLLLFLGGAKYPDLIHKMVVWGANANVTEEDVKLYNGIRDISKWSERTRKPMEAMYGLEYLSKTCSAWVDGISQFIHRPDGNICQSSLPHIKCPTLILHGEKDPLVPRFHPEYIHKHIANS
ncbi:hypothetical protein JRQ81_012379, partial [Phrynocephalus forsythii]